MNIKDTPPFQEQHDVMYYSLYSTENTGRNGRWLNERIKDHNGRDCDSCLFKHSEECRQDPVLLNDFKVIETGCKIKACKRKIADTLLMQKLKSSLSKLC